MAPSVILFDVIQTSILLILLVTAVALEPVVTCVASVLLKCDSIACVAAGCTGIWAIHSLLTKSTKNRKNTTNNPQQMGTSDSSS